MPEFLGNADMGYRVHLGAQSIPDRADGSAGMTGDMVAAQLAQLLEQRHAQATERLSTKRDQIALLDDRITGLTEHAERGGPDPTYRRRWPTALTPAQVCDMHVELGDWIGSDNGVRYLNGMVEFARRDSHTDSVRAATWLHWARNTDLFYVTDDMVQIAADAANDLAGMIVQPHDFVSELGLIVLDTTTPMPYVQDGSLEFPLRGFMFRVDPERPDLGALIVPMLDIDATNIVYGAGRMFSAAPMLPADAMVVDFGQPLHVAVSNLFSDDDGVNAASFVLFALSLMGLMREDRYTAREHVERPARRRWAASGAKVPEDGCLSVTRLRRAHTERHTAPEDTRYSHRWLVRGHWRRIHRGTPGERSVFVHPYVKGPADAPFVAKRKVSVLRG